jgi:hypothetical protein
MEKFFQTTNFDLAAYLFACTLPVETTCGGGMTTFIFPHSAELSALAFYYGASMPAKKLLHAVHELEALKEQR